MNWTEALKLVQGQASKKNGNAADGTPQLTRRDASGLILFGKAAHKLLEKATVRQPDAAHFRSTTFDWYAWSLPVLGWFKRGDKFNTADAWEKAPLDPTTATTLWAALAEQARYLDDAGVPFKMVTNPTGTSATFKTLAMDAYRKMQQLDPKSADVHPHKKPGSSGKSTKPISHDPDHHTQVVRPPTIVIPPPVVVDHPELGTVTLQPPPVVVPPSVPAPVPPPPPGADSAPSSPDAGPGPGGGGGDGPPSPAPPVITPPPLVVPATATTPPIIVQPPPVVAHPINAPQDADPYEWYWNKHKDDPAHDPATWQPQGDGSDATAPKKKKPGRDDKKSDGGGVAILLLVLAMAMDN